MLLFYQLESSSSIDPAVYGEKLQHLANISWLTFKQNKGNSPISDLFEGQQISVQQCQECGRLRSVFEPFSIFTAAIAPARIHTGLVSLQVLCNKEYFYKLHKQDCELFLSYKTSYIAGIYKYLCVDTNFFSLYKLHILFWRMECLKITMKQKFSFCNIDNCCAVLCNKMLLQ